MYAYALSEIATSKPQEHYAEVNGNNVKVEKSLLTTTITHA
jgi:hypothetical protein